MQDGVFDCGEDKADVGRVGRLRETGMGISLRYNDFRKSNLGLAIHTY